MFNKGSYLIRRRQRYGIAYRTTGNSFVLASVVVHLGHLLLLCWDCKSSTLGIVSFGGSCYQSPPKQQWRGFLCQSPGLGESEIQFVPAFLPKPSDSITTISLPPFSIFPFLSLSCDIKCLPGAKMRMPLLTARLFADSCGRRCGDHHPCLCWNVASQVHCSQMEITHR